MKHFKCITTIVFDGCPDGSSYQSTNAVERSWIAVLHSYTKLAFSATTAVSYSKESFLSNDYNKKNLIATLIAEMTATGLEVTEAV